MKLALSGALVLALVLAWSCRGDQALGTELTVNTIRLSLAWYFAALLAMTRLATRDWNATTISGKIARWCWTWGAICFVLHLGMAFHFFHHWSHAHAFAHTREISGIGEGIYFSYFFTCLWIVDALWWWCWPDRFANRSIWWTRLLHGYMLFIVFNGTIIFEEGVIRWFGISMFAILLIAWTRWLVSGKKSIGESYAT